MSDTTREEFEQHAKRAGHPVNRCANGPYVWDETDDMWKLWQAAWTASRQKALQEAAKIADRVTDNRKEDASRNDGRQSDFAFGAVGAAESIASAIRSLGGITSNEGGKERG